jgi:hypothetical protein
MSTITAEEWLREFLNSQEWDDNHHADVHCPRQMIQLIPDHPCNCDDYPDGEMRPAPHRMMTVTWDDVEGLNPRPEYPTPLTAPSQADTNAPA